MPTAPFNALFETAALPADVLLLQLRTSESQGLPDAEVIARQAAAGPNEIDVHKQQGELLQLLAHFKSPLVIILLIAAIISFSTGETVSAIIIVVIVLLSVGMDYWQEHDARNAAAALKQTISNKVNVLRNGVAQEVLPQTLCTGDIVLLTAGRVVPADARVLQARDCFVNQSSLTGESFPAEKNSDPVAGADTLQALQNMVFMGSSIVSGYAKVVVTATGGRTMFGKIATVLVQRPVVNDFQRGIRNFGLLIVKITVLLVLFIFLVNALHHKDLLQSFMFSVAISVGLTPELLPMIMSVTMSRGARRMAARGVIVKNITAIPNFGSMEVLCTDKTGTLTEDKIAMVKCITPDGVDCAEVFVSAYLNSYFQTGVCSPLDEAIMAYRKIDVATCIKLDEIPFDFARKRLSVVVQYGDVLQLICKGAPEEVFTVCTLTSEQAAAAHAQYEALSAAGFRVLAIAIRTVAPAAAYNKADETGLQLQGFAAFLDPPKENVKAVIDGLQQMGVEVKILTGDNALVTRHVCEEIGLTVKGLLTGAELVLLSDEALQQRIPHTTIFTRLLPEQKNRIINLLKKQHRVVGYMGDGINDAPSLKTADIGITVNSAVEVAKEAADIILTQKDLLVLKEGILEGRKTFGNTMKYIRMTLSSNFGNMFSMAVAALVLPFLPMLPVQILVNNFLYDAAQLTIPADRVDETSLLTPQRWDLRSMRRFMLWFGLLSSLFDMATFYLLYSYFRVSTPLFRTGWFMESLATQILVVFIIRTNYIPFVQSKPATALVASAMACLAIGWALPYIYLGHLMGFAPMPLHILLFLAGLVIIYLLCAELLKRQLLDFYKKQPPSRTGTLPLQEAVY